MKSLLNKIKQSLGIDTGDTPAEAAPEQSPADPVQATPVQKDASAFPPAPGMREDIFRFVINKLSPYQGEQATGIRGLLLNICCAREEEREVAGIALYAGTPGKFREELQRKLINNYIQLPGAWTFEFQLCTELPAPCRYRQDYLGLNIIDKSESARNFSPARLRTLVGQTAEEGYLLDPVRQQKFCIGRGASQRLDSGKTHTNDIVFLDREDAAFDPERGEPNLFVSRNHALIIFQSSQNKFFLYADKGGLPVNNNKIKLIKANDQVERVNIAEVGHELEDGDQIELGGKATLLFSC